MTLPNIMSKGPTTAAIPANLRAICLFSVERLLNPSTRPCREVFNGSMLSRISFPNSSETSPSSFFSCWKGPKPALAAASAAPPYCFSSSFR